MISRPMPPADGIRYSHDGGDAALHPLKYQFTHGAHGGYPAPVRRTKSFGFSPGRLPLVNLVRGGPRLY